MGKTIAFTTDEASGVAKGVKRLRGDSRNRAEVKKYNPFNVEILARGIDIYNINSVNVPNVYVAYMPIPLNYPLAGDTSINRVGARIYLKYFRLKGYLAIKNRMVAPVRWRLCLLRVDFNSDVTVTINQNWYLNHFIFVDTGVQSSSTSVSDALSWSRHNFYKKVKDVNDRTFKRKVIASGFIPAVNNHMNYEGQFAGTMGDAPMSGTFEFNGYNNSHAEDQAGYIPVDVTVKLFDNVDCARNLRRYYMVFESDNVIGYDDDLTPQVGYISSSVLRLDAQGLVYFTDA